MIVQACLNGARAVSFHPALPVTPDAIARDAVAAVAAGAVELHIHIRDEDGRETLQPEIIDITIEKLRHACTGTPVGISGSRRMTAAAAIASATGRYCRITPR